MEVEFATLINPARTPPMVTVTPLVKFVPESVRLSPPAAVPEVPTMLVSVGGDGRTSPTPNKSIPEGIAARISRTAVFSPAEVGSNATVTVAVCPGFREVGIGQLVITN
jgi:hypothetical protein